MKILFIDDSLPRRFEEITSLVYSCKDKITDRLFVKTDDLRILDAGDGVYRVKQQLDNSLKEDYSNYFIITNCLEVLDLAKRNCEEKDILIQDRKTKEIYTLPDLIGNWSLKSVSISKMYLDGKLTPKGEEYADR